LYAAAAQLRIQHDIDAKAREGPKPAPGTRTQDMNIGEALFEIEENMMSEKFWVDLGQNVYHVRLAIGEETQDGRMRADELLQAISKSIDKCHMYWKEEQVVLEKIRKLLLAEDPVTLQTPVNGVRSTLSGGGQGYLSESQKKRGKELIKQGEKIKKEYAKQGAFDFEEIEYQTMVTVTIKVPAETQKGDVKVVMKEDSLKVVVKTHEVQPAVIDGTLCGKIDLEESSWSLEGEGEKRKVFVELEKKMGGFMWYQLLKN